MNITDKLATFDVEIHTRFEGQEEFWGYKKAWIFRNQKNSESPIKTVEVKRNRFDIMMIEIFFNHIACVQMNETYANFDSTFYCFRGVDNPCKLQITRLSNPQKMSDLLTSLLIHQFSQEAKQEMEEILDVLSNQKHLIM